MIIMFLFTWALEFVDFVYEFVRVNAAHISQAVTDTVEYILLSRLVVFTLKVFV